MLNLDKFIVVFLIIYLFKIFFYTFKLFCFFCYFKLCKKRIDVHFFFLFYFNKLYVEIISIMKHMYVILTLIVKISYQVFITDSCFSSKYTDNLKIIKKTLESFLIFDVCLNKNLI